MSTYHVMDTISTKNKTYVGVIDFSTTKHVIFYDLTQNNEPDVITLVILWRAYYSHIRFAVFHTLYFKHIKIPSPVMLSKKSIQNLPELDTRKPKTRVLEKFTIQCPTDS